MQITLKCFVLGENLSNSFKVKIDTGDTVLDLKNLFLRKKRTILPVNILANSSYGRSTLVKMTKRNEKFSGIKVDTRANSKARNYHRTKVSRKVGTRPATDNLKKIAYMSS
uniref:Crinkler effector protein N-terminal domain-containing protein n=1 Tax=Rhizophagus irregularis (strain DAOM 181602 / DAOM 197198 / MUCL 43194) TaxID=747089 RepID=U9TSZ8_RHIID